MEETAAQQEQQKQWFYRVSSGSEQVHGPMSATKLCKMFLPPRPPPEHGDHEDESADAVVGPPVEQPAPLLSRSLAKVACSSAKDEFKPFDEFPDLVKILTQIQDPAYEKLKKEKKKNKRKRAKSQIPAVYVSGLPEDVTFQEIYDHFKNIGSIRDDPDEVGKPMIRIYTNEEGFCKGDALVFYEKLLSVPSAVEFLHESQIRPKVQIHVSPAEFDDEKPSAVKKPRMDKNQLAIRKKLEMKRQKDKFSWDEEEDRTTGMRIVIFKNMFSPEEATEDPSFFEDLEIDVGKKCENVGGDLEKITIFRDHLEGVIAVKFKESVGADRCVEALNGKWFGGKRISVEYFDGVTNFKKIPNDDESTRLDKFGEWLEQE
eukprot:TRINITY_DN60314_c0_g4_i1.p2 TRINITY_DN60314_c0_g4~~TRINITY_DN60314_c0_g4_i1.p2  ORF type:complete len:373 (-),score=123.00 TRINITY_DN60314_c0_g4_i1:1425-2543(-)